jgi:hypothetical protein
VRNLAACLVCVPALFLGGLLAGCGTDLGDNGGASTTVPPAVSKPNLTTGPLLDTTAPTRTFPKRETTVQR